MEAQTQTVPPPYFAFKTLTNTIAQMEEHGPPTRIDRTFLRGMSGAGQTQFIAGLRSLGLIDEDGTSQPRLKELVAQPDNRPALISAILRERYPEAVALGERNATTGELVEVFQGYGVRGDTARKAIAFYLQAARFAGDIPLSPHFKTPAVRTGGSGTRKRGRPTNGRPDEAEAATRHDDGIPKEIHPALKGLLSDIPKRGETWTQTEHDNFMAAFTALLRIAAPIVDQSDHEPNEWE